METILTGATVTIYIKGIGRKTGIVIPVDGIELEKNSTHLLKTSRGHLWSFRLSEVVSYSNP